MHQLNFLPISFASLVVSLIREYGVYSGCSTGCQLDGVQVISTKNDYLMQGRYHLFSNDTVCSEIFFGCSSCSVGVFSSCLVYLEHRIRRVRHGCSIKKKGTNLTENAL